MPAIMQKTDLTFLYDTYADKVLGFIVGQNYSKSKAEDILVKVFVEAWDRHTLFNEKENKQHLLVLLKIAANFIYQEKGINPASFLFTKALN